MASFVNVFYAGISANPGLVKAMSDLRDREELKPYKKDFSGQSIEQVALDGLTPYERTQAPLFANMLKKTESVREEILQKRQTTPTDQDYSIKEKLLGDFARLVRFCEHIRSVKYDLYQRANYARTEDYPKELVDQTNRLIPDLGNSLNLAEERAKELFQKLYSAAETTRIVYYDRMKQKLSEIAPDLICLHNRVEEQRTEGAREAVIGQTVEDVPKPLVAPKKEPAATPKSSPSPELGSGDVTQEMTVDQLLACAKETDESLAAYKKACAYLFLKGKEDEPGMLFFALQFYKGEGKGDPDAKAHIATLRLLLWASKRSKLNDLDLQELLKNPSLSNHHRGDITLELLKRECYLVTEDHLTLAENNLKQRNIREGTIEAFQRKQELALIQFIRASNKG